MSRKIIWRIAAAAALACAALIACTYFQRSESPWLHGLAAKVAPPATPFGWPAYLSNHAGDGRAGFADGANARFADPFGLAIDKAGNLYVSDGGENNRIRKIGIDGVTSTLAGGVEGYADGQGALAAFNTPSGLALDGDGNLYVADTGNNAIRKITAQGLVTTLAGTGVAGYRDGAGAQAQLNGPLGVAVDGKGNVYVADTYNDRIRKIAPDGMVTTVAGSGIAGYVDGAAASAQFDTPCAVLVEADGALAVADTRNSALRRIGIDGQVVTLARDGLLHKPVALAATPDAYLYVADIGGGRILQVSKGGEVRPLTRAGAAPDASGAMPAVRLWRPTALALGKGTSLFVADAAQHTLRQLTSAPPAAGKAVVDMAETGHKTAPPWPVKPENKWHEIVGTMGEVRGNYSGVARDHFHAGLDVQAEMGTPVYAIADEKVGSPVASFSYGELAEGMTLDQMSYIHMRVGRAIDDVPFDAARFQPQKDGQGKFDRVRVKRGTRFKTGDKLGTVNRMYHVHLEYAPRGANLNPLTLGLRGYSDTVAPHIEAIELRDMAGKSLSAGRGKRVVVKRALENIAIVVDAYDQVDGNAARRRLGLYKVGYQILHADGSPVQGYAEPVFNLDFGQLPQERDAVTIAYADRSGDTVHGNAKTIFSYVLTNTVRDGRAQSGALALGGFAPGDYIVRIYAQDYAGNVASSGRDLAITVE